MLAFTEESFLSRKKKERPGRGETFIDSGNDWDVTVRSLVIGSSVVMETQSVAESRQSLRFLIIKMVDLTCFEWHR